MKTELIYNCRECGEENKITSFWQWFLTPHMGVKKYLKCKHCNTKKHFMKRKNWNGPWWLDLPY